MIRSILIINMQSPNRSFLSSFSLRSKDLTTIDQNTLQQSNKQSDSQTQSSIPSRDFLQPPIFQQGCKQHPKLKKNRSQNTLLSKPHKTLTTNKSQSSLQQKIYRNPQNTDQLVTSQIQNSLLQTFVAFSFIKRLPEVDPVLLQRISINIPRKPGFQAKKTLIFDLDETLVHCVGNSEQRCDVHLKLFLPSGEPGLVGLNIRPYALDCLRTASEYFQVIVFTASHQCYADAVLDYLDTEGLVYYRLYRNSCIQYQSMYIKDLRILNRSLKDVVLVDNAIYSFGYQIDNGVPIKSWFCDQNDTELLKLTRYFQLLADASDVREINRETFQLSSFCEEVKAEELRQTGKIPLKKKSGYTPRTFAKRM